MTDERALDLLIADYLERVDRGEPIDVERLLAGHPELRDDFHAFVRDMQLVEEHRHSPDESPVSPVSPGAAETDTTPSMLLSETTAISATEPVQRPQDQASAEELPRDLGRYRLLKELGRGAMGTVYLAEDRELRRRVALKRPRLCGVDQQALRQRLYREAQAAATLHHPNICSVYDLGEYDGEPFIIMALIEGRPLSQVIQGGKTFDSRTAASLVRKMALGLAEAHDRGVVHRDLKPGNIMIDPRGEPVVMDFGLAQLAEAATEDRMTQTGMLLGTIGYMSPEQAEGNPTQIGPSTDIYSLGVLLFELLTGRLPFVGSAPQVLRHITTSQPPSPRELQSQIDARLESICLRMLAKSPQDRFATMHEVVGELEAFLRSPIESHAPTITSTSTGRVSHTRRSHSSTLIYIACGCLLLGIAAFTVWLMVRTPYGTIQVRLPNDNASVAIDDGTVTLIDKRTGQQFDLTAGAKQWKSGDYALQVSHGFHLTLTTPDGQKLNASEFTIHSGETILAEVKLSPTTNTTATSSPNPTATAPPDTQTPKNPPLTTTITNGPIIVPTDQPQAWEIIVTAPEPILGLTQLGSNKTTQARPTLQLANTRPLDQLHIRRLWFHVTDLYQDGKLYKTRELNAWRLSDAIEPITVEAVANTSNKDAMVVRPATPLPDGAYCLVAETPDNEAMPQLLASFVVNGLSRPSIDDCRVTVQDGKATIEAKLKNDGDGALNDTRLKMVLSRINGNNTSFVRRMNLNGFDVPAHNIENLQLTFDVSKEMAGEYQLSVFLTPIHNDADSSRVAHAESNVFTIDNSE